MSAASADKGDQLINCSEVSIFFNETGPQMPTSTYDFLTQKSLKV